MSKYGVFCGPNTGKYGREKLRIGHSSRSVNKNENGRTRPDISLKHEGRLGFQGFNRFNVARVVNIKLGLTD